MNEKEAYLVLNAVPLLGSVRIRNLVNYYGSAEKILKVSSSTLTSVEGIGKKIADNTVNWRKFFDLEKEIKLIDKHKINIITITDKDYPALLREIYDPPVVLYAKGDIEVLNRDSVAIVGARRASYYGVNTARRLARELSARGFVVVSGFARGVDTAAHEGVIQASGRTIAVFGCGLDTIYPPENAGLFSKIVSQGIILSEFPFGVPPAREDFPKRNRIISGLSLGVIVVEAGRYSGSLITARMALEQGRDVFSVPGRIDTVTSQGTNVLIKHGARPVLSIDDILEELEPHISRKGGIQPQAGNADKEERKTIGLSILEEKLFGSLTGEPNSVDDIVNNTDLALNDVWTNLVNLELKGLVKRLPGSRFVRHE